MEPFQFQVKPGESAELSFDFKNKYDQADIDILYTDTYTNTIEGRVAKRIEFRNSDNQNQKFITGINTSQEIWRYDLRGECKFIGATGHAPFTDMTECFRKEISDKISIITFRKLNHTPGSGFQHYTTVEITIEIK